MKPDFGWSAYEKQVTNQSFSPGCALLVLRRRDRMSGDVKTTWVEREQWGLSSTHVELFSLTAMTIRHTASQTLAVTLQPPKKKPLTPFCFFVSTLFLFVILLSPSSLHLISFPVRLPSLSKFDSTESTKVCTRQVVGAFAGKHNGFYVCNSHCFKLNVLGWSVDCSPKRCLSFNMSVHEYCMAVRVEARVLGKSLCTSG